MNTKNKPGRAASYILKAVLPENDVSFLAGDYEEEFHEISETRGLMRAHLWYWLLILESVPGFVRNLLYWRVIMFRNYLRITVRNIVKHKGFSFINIFGLAIGMACCLLIFMYVMDELSYDKFHDNADNIYRLTTISSIGSTTNHYDTTPPVLAATLASEIPEIKSFTRFIPEDELSLRYNGIETDIERPFLADTSFFNFFTFEFIAGNAETVFRNPNSIVLTEETAERIFGEEEALGKHLYFRDTLSVEVTGVIKNVPGNSHFTFDTVWPVTMFVYYYNSDRMWQSDYFAELYSYFLIPQKSDLPVINAKIAESVDRNYGEMYAARGTRREYPLQPLKSIHLHASHDTELNVLGDIKYVYAFSMIAFFILCIASINFVNLSTAKSTTRAKEVGLRKVFGAVRGELRKQFMGESLSMTFISLIISLGFVIIAMPQFNQLTGKTFAMGELINFTTITGLIIIFVVTGLLAGSFPAFVLSAFNPVRVMKGNLSSSTGKNSFRKIMVLIQFTISVFMIISVLVILKQMDFLKNTNLGYDSDKIVIINSMNRRNDPLRTRIKQISGVEEVSFSFTVPGRKPNLDAFLPEGNSPDETIRAAAYHADFDFVKTYGLEIVEGRDFSTDYPSDTVNSVLINEKAVKAIGNRENIIGSTLSNVSRGNRITRIVGVVKDYHFRNLKMELSPLVMHLQHRWYQRISVRIRNENIPSTIAALEEVFTEMNPGQDFDYYFLEDDLRSKYPEEEKVREVYVYFGFLAIFVAVLGLFGLASYTIQQRTKEIGIRKVLGASIQSISVSLLKEFSVWVLAANIAAWPLAYIAMNNWLENFAYRTDLSIWLFLLSGIIALFVAIITIGYQAVKAARANPANSLKYE
jgi:putative ABC transport system permease protein